MTSKTERHQKKQDQLSPLKQMYKVLISSEYQCDTGGKFPLRYRILNVFVS